MDDFNVANLNQSKNEWSSRLVNILSPFMIEGIKSIFEESYKLCKENGETSKYLMTFQNFISRIPKWNANIIEAERARIVEKSGCSYLEDLITCVYIIQLKLLTAMRVGQKQKKIDITIPKIDDFIHKVYITIARKIYKYVYLFEINIPPLQIQKNNRELEIIVQECILNTIRESIPIEALLRAYMDETTEEEYTEEIKEEVIEKKLDIKTGGANVVPVVPVSDTFKPSIQFNDVDYTQGDNNTIQEIIAPKDYDTLKQKSDDALMRQKAEALAEEDDDIVKLNITDSPIDLGIEITDIESRNPSPIPSEFDFKIEELPDLLS
jgi:hypothetical protein